MKLPRVQTGRKRRTPEGWQPDAALVTGRPVTRYGAPFSAFPNGLVYQAVSLVPGIVTVVPAQAVGRLVEVSESEPTGETRFQTVGSASEGVASG